MSRDSAYLLVSPIGDIDPALCESIGGHIRELIGMPTRIRSLLDDLSFAFDADRRQYHSSAILDTLAEAAPPSAFKVIGITSVDLFIPILTHVYGEAQLGGKTCVISTHRLRETSRSHHIRPSLKERAVKEAVHELGHTFNLKHCPKQSCTMHYCRSIDDVDRKSADLCRYCRVMLEDELVRISQRESN